MKISRIESGKAYTHLGEAEAKILPKDRPRRVSSTQTHGAKQLSPLERGMALAQEALADVPDTREEFVAELKERIQKGEYNVSGSDIAEMMLRRLAADKIR
jgi:anti-sigma28 factor (negative regulator of flagellin synthesis)